MVTTSKHRHIVGARHAVVHVGAGEELAAVVIDRTLEQRLADALRQPAMDLALDDHRVDDVAEIVDRDEAQDVDDAGRRLDLDLADVGARGIGEVRRVEEGRFLEARLDGPCG